MQRILYFAIFLVVFFTFINAIVFFGIGIYQSIMAYIDIAYGRWDNHPGVILVESLDRFVFGFVFIIFSIGLTRLFLPDASFLKNYELPWLKITDFFQLKTLLISAILVALLVAWAPVAIGITQHKEPVEWTTLIFPASLVMLAIAGKFIKELH